MRRFLVVLGAALCAGGLAGCVERTYHITSDPPGALVYSNGRPLSATPADNSFVYHGYYDFTLVKPGYQTLHVRQKIKTPWYEYFPLDFISENLIPWRIHEDHRFHYVLEPAKTPQTDELLPKAENLRAKGQSLQVPPPPPEPQVPVRTPPVAPIVESPPTGGAAPAPGP